MLKAILSLRRSASFCAPALLGLSQCGCWPVRSNLTPADHSSLLYVPNVTARVWVTMQNLLKLKSV